MPTVAPTRPSRRQALAGASALFGWSALPHPSSAAGARDFRLIVVVLRGAMDGLSAVPPLGDPDYAGLRQELALTRSDSQAPFRLDTQFSLHPALSSMAGLYAAKQLLVVHAVASPYRERSHFDAQDVLESGGVAPGGLDSGWLNRVAQTLPAEGQRAHASAPLAVGATAPLILRGKATVSAWAPRDEETIGGDLLQRALALYGQTDPLLEEALRQAVQTQALAAGVATPRPMQKGVAIRAGLQARQLARLIRGPDGARLVTLSLQAWDTHQSERDKLTEPLEVLDATLEGLQQELGPVWADTVVLVVTEFGRTVQVNGTQGTDHGTATAAFLAGGRVKGGRVLGDWPGLKLADLHEGRDLKPTTDIRAVQKGLLTELIGTSPSVLATDIFPDSAAVKPLSGLLV